MSKEDIYSFLVYIGMLAIAIVVGVTLLMPNLNKVFDGTGAIILFVVIALLIGILLNAILLELFHCLGAKISGYEVISVNILGLFFYKVLNKDGKKSWKVKPFKSFDGLCGETKVMPKSDKTKPVAMLGSTIILYVIEAVALYFAIYFSTKLISKGSSNVGLLTFLYGVIVVATVGFMFALYNYVPVKTDSTTDGYKLFILSKKDGVQSFNDYLEATGKEFLGMPVDNLHVYENINDFTAQYNMFTVYNYLAEDKYEEANNLLEAMTKDPKKLSKYPYLEYTCNQIYIQFMMNELTDEEAKKLGATIKTEMHNYIYKTVSFGSYKTYLLICGLVDKSKNEAISTKEKFDKLYAKSTDPFKDREKALFDKAYDRIISKL